MAGGACAAPLEAAAGSGEPDSASPLAERSSSAETTSSAASACQQRVVIALRCVVALYGLQHRYKDSAPLLDLSATTASIPRWCTCTRTSDCLPPPQHAAVQQLVGTLSRWLTTTDTFTIGRVCQGSAPGPSAATSSTLFKLSRLRAFLTMACRARGPAWQRSCGSALTTQDLCTPLAARPQCGTAHRAISQADCTGNLLPSKAHNTPPVERCAQCQAPHFGSRVSNEP